MYEFPKSIVPGNKANRAEALVNSAIQVPKPLEIFLETLTVNVLQPARGADTVNLILIRMVKTGIGSIHAYLLTVDWYQVALDQRICHHENNV